MMTPYPFFGFPPFRRPYPYYPVHSPIKNATNDTEKPYFPNSSVHSSHSNNAKKNVPFCNSPQPCVEPHKRPEHSEHFGHFGHLEHSEHSEHSERENEEYFEIFGIKLYFDDLLLIALLFFLYQEDVKDTYLYIALVLLLLS